MYLVFLCVPMCSCARVAAAEVKSQWLTLSMAGQKKLSSHSASVCSSSLIMDSSSPPLVDDLLRMVQEEGGNVNKVELKYSKEGGYSVHATHNISPGEIVISVPYSMCLSVDSILKGPLSEVLDQYPDILNHPDEVLAMALMCTAYPEDSIISKHIASLPKSLNTPIFWTENELDWLKGCTVWNLTNMMKKQIFADWENLHQPYKKYKWALSIVYSRALGITRDGVYIRVIPPVVDMANHHPDAATDAAETLSYSSLDDSLLLISHKARAPGEECQAFYGNYSNSKLLYSYGFVIPHLSRRTVDLWPSLSAGVPYADVKQQILQSNALTNNQTYDFEGTLRSGGWISPSLLATIRIIQATGDEFNVIGTGEATKDGSVRSTYKGGFVSSRNEISSLTSLRDLLRMRLRSDSAQEESDKYNEFLSSKALDTNDRLFMSLVVKMDERETVQECLNVVSTQLKNLEEHKT